MSNDVVAKGAAKSKPEKPKGDKSKVERGGEGFFDKITKFVRESYVEVVKKASWPSWPELKKFTTVVIIAVLIVGFYIGILDFGLGKLTAPLLRGGGAP